MSVPSVLFYVLMCRAVLCYWRMLCSCLLKSDSPLETTAVGVTCRRQMTRQSELAIRSLISHCPVLLLESVRVLLSLPLDRCETRERGRTLPRIFSLSAVASEIKILILCRSSSEN
jgi:hypothetical protein